MSDRRNEHYRDLLAAFPALNGPNMVELSREILDVAAPFEPAIMRAALALHRRELGARRPPDPGRLSALLLRYAVAPPTRDPETVQPGQRIVDFLRRKRPGPGEDFDFLAEHFRQSWEAVKQKAPSGTALELGRRIVLHDAVKALKEIGFPRDEAIAQGRVWVELPAEEPATP